MPKSCIIHRGGDGNVSSVTTRAGRPSKLYSAFAGIPLMENRERAASFVKKCYSKEFLKWFGDWTRNTPKNPEAVRRIEAKARKLFPEKRRDIARYAANLDNPIMVRRANPGLNTEGVAQSYYSETEGEGDWYIVDAMDPSEVDTTTQLPEGASEEDFTPILVSAQPSPVVRVTKSDGSSYYMVRPFITRQNVRDITGDGGEGITYDTGEPRLFFLTGEGRVYDNYGDAIRATKGTEIEAGFIRDAGAISPDGSVPEAGLGAEGRTLSDKSSFKPFLSIPADSRPFTRNGIINYLVRKGILSGERVLNPYDNRFYFTGEGRSGAFKMFNSALAFGRLLERMFPSFVRMDEEGRISIGNFNPERVELKGSRGTRDRVTTRDGIRRMLKEGRYGELRDNYLWTDPLITSIVFEDAAALRRGKTDTERREDDTKQREAILDILQTLGVRVMGMSDYLEKYHTKFGHEPDARALADIANNVIALAEDATAADLAEETAHFLVEAYANQGEITEALREIRNTPEWGLHASRYYEIYGKTLQGTELENAVEREILGKVLARSFRESFHGEPTDNTGTTPWYTRLWRNIVNFFKGNLKDQKGELDRVVGEIRSAALSNNKSLFDTSYFDLNPLVLYSAGRKNTEKRQDFLKRQEIRLKNTLSRFRYIRSEDRAGEAIASAGLSNLSRLSGKINELNRDIDENSFLQSISGVISTAEAMTSYMRKKVDNVLENASNEKEAFSPQERAMVDVLDEQMMPVMTEMRAFIGKEDNLLDTEKKDFRQRIDKVVAELSAIKSDLESSFAIDQKGFFEGLMDKLQVNKEDQGRIFETIKKVQKDISIFARWFGIAEHMGNPVDNILGTLISNNYYRANAKTQDDLRGFLREAQRGGWKVKDFERLIKKDANGRFSKYLLNPIDMAKFSRAIKIAQMEALQDALPLSEIAGMSPKEIADYVDSGKVRRFDLGNGKTARIKPSADYFSTNFLSADEEQVFTQRMSEWMRENEEDPMNQAYRDREAGILADAEKKLGRKVSAETLEFLQNISRQKWVIKSNPAFWDDPVNRKGFRFDVFAESPAMEQFARLSKMRREAASEYVYVGGSRQDKGERELEIAEEIQAIDEARRARYEAENRNDTITRDTFNKIREIQKTKGAKAAMQFLLYGGHLSFTDKFYEDSGISGSSAGLPLGYEGMARKIAKKLPEKEESAMWLSNEIKKRQEIIRSIVRFNRDPGNPGEVEVGNMTSNELDTVRTMTEEIETMASQLKSLAKKAGVDPDSFFKFDSDVADSGVTNEFLNDARDFTGEEFYFSIRHMTKKKRNLVENFYRRLLSKNIASVRWSEMERELMEEMWGIPALVVDKNDAEEHSNLVAMYMEGMEDFERTDTAIRITNMYARKFLFPYYKKTAPTGFVSFINNVLRSDSPGSGDVDVSLFLKDLMEGTKSQDYPFNMGYLQYSPNLEWTEEMETRGDTSNPGYVEGYGVHHPKADIYRDEEYYSYFGIDSDGNPTRHLNDFNMIRMLTDLNREAFKQYAVKNRSIYAIPQISKDMPERIKYAVDNNDPMSAVTNWLRDTFTDTVDDSIYGNTDNNEQPVEEERPKMVPRYYLNDLENADDVAHDLISSFGNLMAQANLYAEKRDSYAYVMGLEQMLLRMKFDGGRKPESTRAYAYFRNFVDDHWYGIRSNTKRHTVNIMGYDIDLTKFMNWLEKTGSMMDIAFSLPVAVTGAFTGNINMGIEAAVGQYIDKDSLLYANSEFLHGAKDYVGGIGNLDRTDKLYVIGERLGAFSLRNRLYAGGFDRSVRVATRDIFYKMIELVTFNIHPTMTIAVLDGARLYKGRFYTKEQLQALKESGEDAGLADVDFQSFWKGLRKDSLWNAINVVDGGIRPREGITMEQVEQGLALRRNTLRSVLNVIDGSLNEEQRTAAARDWVLRFATTHRGWLPLAAQRIFKRRGYNFQTGRMEEGYMLSLRNFLKAVYEMGGEKGYVNMVSNIRKTWKEILDKDPVMAVNMRRMMTYLQFYGMAFVSLYFLLGWTDDDDNKDDWMAQMAAYIALRTTNEVSSNMPLFFLTGLTDIISDPFPMGRKLLDMATPTNYSLDKVETGSYEGMPKLFRHLARQTFLKQYFSLQSPEDVARTRAWWQQTNFPVMYWYGASRKSDEEE